MAVGREGETGNVTISPGEHKDERFQPTEDTFQVVLVIPEHLASIRAVVLAFTANKQTNTQI